MKPILSWTQYSLFSKCPLAWHMRGQTQETPSESAQYGKQVHESIAAYLASEVSIPSSVHESWHELFVELKQKPVEVEKEVRLETDNFIVLGYIDCLTPSGEVYDWKTGKKPKTRDPHLREQLYLYAWLLGRSVTGHLCWIEHPRRIAQVTVEVEYTPHLQKLWQRRFETMLQSDPVAVPSWFCSYCFVEPCSHRLTNLQTVLK